MLGPKGPAKEVIRQCLLGAYKPIISNALFLEYEAIVFRPHLLAQCMLTPEEQRDLLNAYYSLCEWVPIYYRWRPNLPDEGDNFLVELAIAGKAGYVITNNIKDLKRSELVFDDLQVVTPEQLLRG